MPCLNLAVILISVISISRSRFAKSEKYTEVVKGDETRRLFGNKGCKERSAQRRWLKKTRLEGYLATRAAKSEECVQRWLKTTRLGWHLATRAAKSEFRSEGG